MLIFQFCFPKIGFTFNLNFLLCNNYVFIDLYSVDRKWNRGGSFEQNHVSHLTQWEISTTRGYYEFIRTKQKNKKYAAAVFLGGDKGIPVRQWKFGLLSFVLAEVRSVRVGQKTQRDTVT